MLGWRQQQQEHPQLQLRPRQLWWYEWSSLDMNRNTRLNHHHHHHYPTWEAQWHDDLACGKVSWVRFETKTVRFCNRRLPESLAWDCKSSHFSVQGLGKYHQKHYNTPLNCFKCGARQAVRWLPVNPGPEARLRRRVLLIGIYASYIWNVKHVCRIVKSCACAQWSKRQSENHHCWFHQNGGTCTPNPFCT